MVEVRRVFMFLIERLPKESDGKSGAGSASFDAASCDKRTVLENSLMRNIDIQLNAAWTPQYCKKFGVREFGNLVAIHASNSGFLPQNLNVPHVLCPNAPNGKYHLHRMLVETFIAILHFHHSFYRTTKVLAETIADNISANAQQHDMRIYDTQK